MHMSRDCKSWFKRMRTLALLAVLSLVASPAFAANCCCDEMGETGHSHSLSATTHHHDSQIAHTDAQSANLHAAHSHSSDAIFSSFVHASVNGVRDHAPCEVAPPVVLDNQNKHSLFSPIFAIVIRAHSLQTPDVLSTTTFFHHVFQPRAPDRFSCSGLSPPASSRS